LLVSQGSRGVRFASEATAYQRGQMVYRQDIQILRVSQYYLCCFI
jgi:hypothetical protein